MFSSDVESNRGKAIGRSVDHAICRRKSRSGSLVGPTFVVRNGGGTYQNYWYTPSKI
jgi:hypothetical protein